MRTAVVNNSRSVLRRRRTATRHLKDLDRGDHPGADQAILADARDRQLRSAVAELPRRQREVVVLRYWSELSLAEVAVAGGGQPGTERALAPGRELRFGIRLHVITRNTAAEAWDQANRLLDGLDPAAIERAQDIQRASQSEGQRRMSALHGGRTDSLEVSPNLWAGVGLVRGGAGTALVGSHDEVAERIAEYYALGIDEFILSGYPHLEEAYQVGEGLIPVLRRRGLMASRTLTD